MKFPNVNFFSNLNHRSFIILWTAFLFLVSAFLYCIAFFYRFLEAKGLLTFFIGTSGFFESLQVISLLLSALILLKSTLSYRKNKFPLIPFLLILLLFWAACEEADYGQIYFHFKTPEFFSQNNEVGAFNVHHLVIGNLRMTPLIYDFLIWGSLSFFLFIPLLASIPFISRICDFLSIPIVPLSFIPFLILFSKLQWWFPEIPWDKSESRETLTDLIFLGTMISTHIKWKMLSSSLILNENRS